jgi:hypothetical protein
LELADHFSFSAVVERVVGEFGDSPVAVVVEDVSGRVESVAVLDDCVPAICRGTVVGEFVSYEANFRRIAVASYDRDVRTVCGGIRVLEVIACDVDFAVLRLDCDFSIIE